jgi:hypothetical protein
MALAFLSATRDTNSCSLQDSLLNRIDRGGLWNILKSPLNVFEIAENNFNKYTNNKHLRNIDTDEILRQTLLNSEINLALTHLIEKSEIKVERSIAKDTLYNMVTLYIRVRSHSKARHLLEQFKQKQQKGTKSKSLRKDIKRASDAL